MLEYVKKVMRKREVRGKITGGRKEVENLSGCK